MKKRTIALRCLRSHVSFSVGTALLLGASLASAQAAVAPRAAAPAEPAPAAPIAPTTTESGPATAPSSELGTSAPAAAVDASAPAVAPAPSTQPAQAPAGAVVAADAVATPEASGETAAQAEDSAEQVAEELSGEAGKINIYGFTDFTYSRVLSDRAAFNVPPSWYPSFYVGNFNLYLGSDLGKNWRTLSEVRFTYLPDGTQSTTFDPNTGASTTTRNSAAYPDYADYNAERKVGGVIIERAYLEYAADPLFTIRGGQFLTPYGIWNVEHGTTVIVGTTRPYVVGANLFPAHQTGLEFYGTYGVSSTQVGYHVTFSNGRGPVDTYRDLDKNTAIGWRLWAQQDTDFGTFTFGTSGYKGRYTDRLQTTSITTNPSGTIVWKFDYPIQSEYRELALALDFKWTWKGALFQSEAIMRDQVYENGTRPTALTMGGPTAWTPDQRTAGFYALGGYRLPWLGIMPYFGGEYYYLSKTTFSPDAMAVWGGFNVRPTDRVVLKLQYTNAWFPSNWLDGWQKPNHLNQLISQAAWSF